MIEFRQKFFSEYDAMKSLYEELKRYARQNRNTFSFSIIDSSALIPILKGNNIVIERFVISTSFGKKDKYRMYLKVGAKAKLPDEVRLPSYDKRNNLFNLRFKVGTGIPRRKYFSGESEEEQREFTKDNKNKNGGGGGNAIESGLELYPDLSYTSNELKGETLKYDRKERSLVLEFPDIRSAVEALNILPFGLNYKIYLLDV